MSEHIFAGLDGLVRSEKPRTSGLTMVADWGIGPNAQADLIATGKDYIDFAKIAVGISRLLSNDLLQSKLKHYRDNQIEPFVGGQYLEHAEIKGKFDLYFPATSRNGLRCSPGLWRLRRRSSFSTMSSDAAPVAGTRWKGTGLGVRTKSIFMPLFSSKLITTMLC